MSSTLNILLKFTITIVLIALLSSCFTKKLETQIFLVPEGYVGHINIVYQVPNGASAKYEDDAHVYDINSQGVHITQIDYPSGMGTPDSFQFYYVDQYGKREKILLSNFVQAEDIEAHISDPNTYVIYGSVGSIGSYPCDFGSQEFYIGTYQDRVENNGARGFLDYLSKNPEVHLESRC